MSAALSPRGKKWARRIATLVVVAVAMTGVWWLLRSLDVRQVGQTLETARPGWVGLAFACGLLAQLTRAVGWRAMLPPPIGLGRLLSYELLAQASSAISPEGSGELVRVGLLRRHGIDGATTLTLMVVRKLFSSLGLVPLLLVMVWPGSAVPPWARLVAAGYTVVLVVVLGVLARASRPATRDIATRRRLAARLQVARAALGFLRRAWPLTGLAASSVLTRLLDLAALLLLAHALSLHLQAGPAILVLLLVEVSNALPTAPAQLGTFDAAALTALTTVLSQDGAAALTLAFHAQQLLPQVVGGVVVGLGHLAHRTTHTVLR